MSSFAIEYKINTAVPSFSSPWKIPGTLALVPLNLSLGKTDLLHPLSRGEANPRHLLSSPNCNGNYENLISNIQQSFCC